MVSPFSYLTPGDEKTGGKRSTTLLPPLKAIVSTWNADTTPFALLLRLACYLAAFAIPPSLCLTPPLGILLVPFVLIPPAYAEEIGERQRLRTTMIAFAIIHLGVFLFFLYPLLTGSSADWENPDGTPVSAIVMSGFTSLWPFSFGIFSTSPICGLYRLDHPFTQEEIDSVEPARAPTITSDLEPKVGDDIVVTPLRTTLSAWVNSSTRSRPTLNYSTAAILWTSLWLIGLPVFFNYTFVSRLLLPQVDCSEMTNNSRPSPALLPPMGSLPYFSLPRVQPLLLHSPSPRVRAGKVSRRGRQGLDVRGGLGGKV